MCSRGRRQPKSTTWLWIIFCFRQQLKWWRVLSFSACSPATFSVKTKTTPQKGCIIIELALSNWFRETLWWPNDDQVPADVLWTPYCCWDSGCNPFTESFVLITYFSSSWGLKLKVWAYEKKRSCLQHIDYDSFTKKIIETHCSCPPEFHWIEWLHQRDQC